MSAGATKVLLSSDEGSRQTLRAPRTDLVVRTGAAIEDGIKTSHSQWPVLAVLSGVLLVSASAAILTDKSSTRTVETTSVGASPVPLFPTISTAAMTYIPGDSSGWHVHPGIHSVVVLSGTLTVYDDACTRHDYGPGQSYVGGQERHLALNKGEEAANLVVTYVSDPSAHSAGSPVAAPSSCEAP